ncbi:hypothetical protein [Chryseolinea sp. H1M3-3]|uniref:hypothetical protein n=1 Tax=Chryseolinea sp. H1M3-3 TaxID=3034144 RepID=UPI0023ED1317|nr:hypothetical protein [Chryseolinea sp. H1M3-3]
MKKLLLLLLCLIQACSTVEQNELIESKNLGLTTSGNVVYDLYQTGPDNYRYEFSIVDKGDSAALFTAYLNDASFESVELYLLEQNDTIKIRHNRSLGEHTKLNKDKVYQLTRKPDAFEGFSATVHGESGKISNLMIYHDSITHLPDSLTSIHRKIWELDDVEQMAKELKKKNILTYTLIEAYPTDSINYYTISFGQALKESLRAIWTYRISLSSGQVEKAR